MTLHYRGWPLMAHATAAKAGVDALTRTLALEWAADHITVNAVAPGPIPTEGVRKAFTPPDAGAPDIFRMDEYAARAIPLGRKAVKQDDVDGQRRPRVIAVNSSFRAIVFGTHRILPSLHR